VVRKTEVKEKIRGIYKIKNITNNKVYIGSSVNIHKRWEEHKTKLRNNKHHSYKLQRAWNKYGQDNFIFETIDIFNGEIKELRELEQDYLDLFKSYDFKYGYNVSESSITPNPQPPTEYKDIVDGKFLISKEEFDEVIYYLCNTKIPIPKILEITGVQYRTIYQIYFKENYTNVVKDMKFLQRTNSGEEQWKSILTEVNVLEIISMLLDKKFMIDIARKYSVNTSTIWDIYNYKTWNSLTKNIIFPEYLKASGRYFKPIEQYDLENNYISTFESAREAERVTGIGYKMISRVCKGERLYTHGFIWKFVS